MTVISNTVFRLSVKARIGNRGTECGESGWECGESGWECGEYN